MMEVKPPELIYGYPVRDLVVAATVMRRSGIEPEDLRKLCHNLDFAFNVAWEELEKTIERAMAESQGLPRNRQSLCRRKENDYG